MCVSRHLEQDIVLCLIAKGLGGTQRCLFLRFSPRCWRIPAGRRISRRVRILITPLHSNAINLTYSFYHGGLDFNGVVPITGATGSYSTSTFSLYHSFSFFGRSANIAAWLPYGVGTFQGSVLGTAKQIYRSGLFDSGLRLSVNLKGGPAMPISQFVKWKQTVVWARA